MYHPMSVTQTMRHSHWSMVSGAQALVLANIRHLERSLALADHWVYSRHLVGQDIFQTRTNNKMVFVLSAMVTELSREQ